jgi:tetratricopeptide (TPR) repeat protein
VRQLSFSTLLAIALAAGLLALAGGAGETARRAVAGNLAIVECWRTAQASPTFDCGAERALPSQQALLETSLVVEEWRSKHYGDLANRYTDELCPCQEGLSGRTATLPQRVQTFYVVLAYRLEHGYYPAIDRWGQQIVSSSFMWRQAQRMSNAGDQAEAALAQELAYLVDKGWSSEWERGLVASRQADVYRTSGSDVLARQAYLRAIRSFEQSQYDEAGAFLARARGLFAELEAEQGNIAEAESAHLDAVLASPRHAARSFEALVGIWQQQGYSLEEIAARFMEMRDQHAPDDPYMTSGPATALLKHGGGVVELALLLASASSSVLSEPSVLGIQAELAKQADDVDQARDFYVDALAKTRATDPSIAANWASHLAELAEAVDDLDEALEYRELAVELNPRPAIYWYNLAQLYRKLDRWDQAEASIQTALQRAPNNRRYQQVLNELRAERES